MLRRPPSSTRPDPLFPYTTLFRSLAPLAAAFAERFHAFLPNLTDPLRVGTHFNVAFALLLARHWAESRDPALVALIDTSARNWFEAARHCQDRKSVR